MLSSPAIVAYRGATSKKKGRSVCSWSENIVKFLFFSLEVAVEGKRQGVTKKNLNTPSARLKICKLELFRNFVEVYELRHLNFSDIRDIKAVSYKEAKELAAGYNDCWKSLRESFKVWTNKDVNLLQFSIK